MRAATYGRSTASAAIAKREERVSHDPRSLNRRPAWDKRPKARVLVWPPNEKVTAVTVTNGVHQGGPRVSGAHRCLILTDCRRRSVVR